MIDKIIQSRKSVKKFNSNKPDWRNIIECIDAMRFAPMAGNNFSLKFILVDDKEKIIKIAHASEQRFIENVQYIVVVCTDPGRTKIAFEDRAELYLRQQAGAAIENFLLKITEIGLSTCWIGHFQEERIKECLRIPENIRVEALFPIGYEFKKTPLKRKPDLDALLYFNEYKKKKMDSRKRVNI